MEIEMPKVRAAGTTESSKKTLPSEWEKPTGPLDASDARMSWLYSDAPKRHVGAIALRETATGKWLEKYQELRDTLGTGALSALLGPRGTGKTQLGVCLLRTMAECRFTVKYIKALDLFRLLRSCFQPGGPNEMKLVRQFTSFGLLVIDESHERGNSDFENRTLTNLLDKRYDIGTDTLLISNQTPQAFAEAAGPSVVSRLHETGRCVVCDWPSYRDGSAVEKPTHWQVPATARREDM